MMSLQKWKAEAISVSDDVAATRANAAFDHTPIVNCKQMVKQGISANVSVTGNLSPSSDKNMI